MSIDPADAPSAAEVLAELRSVSAAIRKTGEDVQFAAVEAASAVSAMVNPALRGGQNQSITFARNERTSLIAAWAASIFALVAVACVVILLIDRSYANQRNAEIKAENAELRTQVREANVYAIDQARRLTDMQGRVDQLETKLEEKP